MPSEKFQQAVRAMARTERFMATVYAVNALLIERGVYSAEDFESRFLEWGARECPAAMRVRPTMAQIAMLVGVDANIDIDELRGDNRAYRIGRVRQLAQYLMRSTTTASFQEIGGFFGKHYTTAIHSYNVIAERRKTDGELDEKIKRLVAELRTRKDTQC